MLVKSSLLALSYSFHSLLFYLKLGGSFTVPMPYTGCWRNIAVLEKMCPELSWQQPRLFRSQEGDFQGPSRMLWPGHCTSFALPTHEGGEKKSFWLFLLKDVGYLQRCLEGESVLSVESVLFPAVGCHYMRYALQHYFIAACIALQALCLQPFLMQCLGLHAVIAKVWLTAVQLSSVQVLLLWHGEQPGEIGYRTSKRVWSERFKKCCCEWNGNKWRKKG